MGRTIRVFNRQKKQLDRIKRVVKNNTGKKISTAQALDILLGFKKVRN